MRPLYLSLLLLFVLDVSFAQDRRKVTDEVGDKYRKTKEVYFVLPSDKSIKDGPYQLFRNDKLITSGYYKNGQKDSIWEIYNSIGILLSRKRYDQGRTVGKWEFFDWKGAPAYTYDFTTGKLDEQTPRSTASDTTTHFYLNDAGQWVRGKLDKKPVPLFGPGEWLGYLNRNFRYPDQAVNNMEQGTVRISMVVDENGRASDYAVFTPVSPSLDKEALRVVSGNENLFIPAEKDGKKVRTIHLQPMVFKMESN